MSAPATDPAATTPAVDDTTDLLVRYAAYANRLRTILRASHRYVAYTSDIGELFRPVAHPTLVLVGYGILWLYILGDVLYEGWKAKLRQEGRYHPGLRPWDAVPAADPAAAVAAAGERDWKWQALQRGVFQLIALMGLPAFTIHLLVRYSSVLFKLAPPTLKTYGPVGVGLAVVPVLPYLFDEPVEKAVEWVFDEGEKMLGSRKLD